jgi:hypothetical protein
MNTGAVAIVNTSNTQEQNAMNPILYDSINLSSGTIAIMSGFRNYPDIHAIHLAFVEFVRIATENGQTFETWMQAWNGFTSRRQQFGETVIDRGNVVAKMDAEV